MVVAASAQFFRRRNEPGGSAPTACADVTMGGQWSDQEPASRETGTGDGRPVGATSCPGAETFLQRLATCCYSGTVPLGAGPPMLIPTHGACQLKSTDRPISDIPGIRQCGILHAAINIHSRPQALKVVISDGQDFPHDVP